MQFTPDDPLPARKDFSFIAEKVPGFYINPGGRPLHVSQAEAPAHHGPEFRGTIADSGSACEQ
jgi:hypothetical protein